MKMYSMDNNENFPGTFRTGMVEYANNPKLYVCPSDTREPADGLDEMDADTCSYNMAVGYNEASPSTYMHACDKNGTNSVTEGANGFGGNHQGDGGNILYIDGSVLWVKATTWENDPTNAYGGPFPGNLSEY
jgi:prepilin-type processing-associated H-X9-DG protein